MNLFGKILVALNLVMSLVFMGFAIAVYSTHKNWRDVVELPPEKAAPPDKPQGLKYDIEALRKEKADLLSSVQELAARIDFEKKVRDDKLSTAEQKAVDFEKEAKAKTDALAAKTAEQQETAATVAKLASQVETKSTEVAKLQGDVETIKQQRDDMFDQLIVKQNEVAKLEAEKAKLETQNRTLIAQANDARGPAKPLTIDGVVRDATNDGLVEISLGTDDGVTRGMSMFVYRPGATPAATKLLGKIEILRTTADVSVGKVIPEFRKGNIEKDDRVATRFN